MLREKRPNCLICVLGRRIGGVCMGGGPIYMSWPSQHMGGMRFQGGDIEGSWPQVFQGNLAD